MPQSQPARKLASLANELARACTIVMARSLVVSGRSPSSSTLPPRNSLVDEAGSIFLTVVVEAMTRSSVAPITAISDF
jgi:hypothetical protein